MSLEVYIENRRPSIIIDSANKVVSVNFVALKGDTGAAGSNADVTIHEETWDHSQIHEHANMALLDMLTFDADRGILYNNLDFSQMGVFGDILADIQAASGYDKPIYYNGVIIDYIHGITGATIAVPGAYQDASFNTFSATGAIISAATYTAFTLSDIQGLQIFITAGYVAPP